jgi:hypothetical protein
MSSQQSAENRPLKRKMILQQQMAHFPFLRTIGLLLSEQRFLKELFFYEKKI